MGGEASDSDVPEPDSGHGQAEAGSATLLWGTLRMDGVGEICSIRNTTKIPQHGIGNYLG